ncbi:MAG: hypothetical protein AB7S26_02265 [Sandaracinaceae bacterium]
MRISTTIALTLAVGLVTGRAEAQLLSPGPLSSDHHELDGDTGCARCHESGRRVSASLCNTCHQDVARTIRARTGLHGREYQGRDCGSCHVEHRGRSTALVRWPSGGRDNFDHALSGWRLEGAHQRVQCSGCHDRRNSRGHATFLSQSNACRSCHEDPHSRRFGTNCASCHSQTRWSEVRMEQFDHSRTRYPLRGAHQRVDCAGCHGTPSRWTGIQFSQCSSCHRDPHAGQYGGNCSGCHTVSAWSELGAVRENHPGLRLVGGHRSTACESCHDRGVNTSPSRGSACVSCHRAVHEAPFGNRCEGCHASIRWTGLPERVSLRAHERTPFPLVGEHRETECSACHREELPREERWRQLTFGRCADCHQDPHSGEFASREGGECAQCHNESGFAPTQFGVDAHAHTSFALEGLHTAVACGGCHRNERPRLDWHVADRACADCHENPHGDQFASEMARGGCAACHSDRGWDRPNIDHSTWPLDGAHALVACGSCHSPTEADRHTGQGASYRGVPRECEGCHEDEHAGQFRLSAPQRACTVCHSTASFAIAHFDHEHIADYPLVGRHAAAECAACHPSVALEGSEDQVTRYRLGYRECSDCHADPHAGASR